MGKQTKPTKKPKSDAEAKTHDQRKKPIPFYSEIRYRERSKKKTTTPRKTR